MRSTLSALALMLALTGCSATTGTNVKWWSPGTWFSGSEARSADRARAEETKAEKAVDDKHAKAVHSAAVEVFKASISAQALPDGNPKDLTVRFIGNGLGLLQQTTPLTSVESSEAVKIVQGLLSDQVELRKSAQAKQLEAEGALSRVSSELESAKSELLKASAKSEAKDVELRKAFARENALANEYRNIKAALWIVSGLAVLAILGWLYARFMLGGIPGALGQTLAVIGQKNAPLADELRSSLDTFLNRHEQSTIFKAYAKASLPKQTK